MMNQVKFQWIKKFAAVISIISIIMPSPAYSSREVRTANSPVVLNELTGDLLAAGIGRAELRSIPRNLEGQIFHVSANQVKGTSPLWTVSNTKQNPADIRRIEAEVKGEIGKAFDEQRTFVFYPADVTVTKDDKKGLVLDNKTNQQLQDLIAAWKQFRYKHEDLNEVLPDEEKTLTQDLIASIDFIQQAIEAIKEPATREQVSHLRFVLVIPVATPNTEQGDLMEAELGIRPPALHFYGKQTDAKGTITSLYYGEEQPGFFFANKGISVIGTAGKHYYEAFKPTEESSPQTLYIPLSRAKRYARLAAEAEGKSNLQTAGLLRDAFRDWALQAKSSLAVTLPYLLSPDGQDRLVAAEELIASDFHDEYAAYLAALTKTHRNRTREYKVDVNLLRWLNTQTIPAQIEDDIKYVLNELKKQGEITDYTVLRIADDLTIFISHKRPTDDAYIAQVARKAILHALSKANEAGIYQIPEGENDLLEPDVSNKDLYQGLRWRAGNMVYTIRPGAHPTFRAKYFGGSRRAFDIAMYDAYANASKTTMPAIEGIPGWYYVSESVEDLREGKQDVKGIILRHPNNLAQLTLALRDEAWATAAIFPGKQAKVRMDEPAVFTFLDSNYTDEENPAKNPNATPFSPWIFAPVHNGFDAFGTLEGVTMEPKIVEGADRLRAIQPVTLVEAAKPGWTWKNIKGEPVIAAVALKVHVNSKGEYDTIDAVSMTGKTTEYQDHQPQYDAFRDLLKRQGDFQFGLTTHASMVVADQAWDRLQQTADENRAELRSKKIGDVLIGVPEDLTDRKARKLPSSWNYALAHQLVNLTIKKYDIGGKGHGAPEPFYEPTVDASLAEAKQRVGSKLTGDYLTFSIGDDLQLLMAHHDGPLSEEIGQYAWDAAFRAGWAVKALQIDPYGFLQDIPGAKNKNVRDEAQLNPEFIELLKTQLREWANDPKKQEYLRINHRNIDDVAAFLEQEFHNPQVVKPHAIGGVVQAAGNLVGSGIGNADLIVTPWIYELTQGRFGFLGFDKASPAVYNPLVVEAVMQMVADGVFENVFFDIQKVHHDKQGRERHILLDTQSYFPEIMKLLGNSSGYQLSDLFVNDSAGNLHPIASFTTDRLFQVLLALTGKPAYGGKDDPEAIMIATLLEYMNELINSKRKFYFVLGNERGSNLRLVRWTPVHKPYLGQYSDPTAAAGLFQISPKGEIVLQGNGEKFHDLFDTPQMTSHRQDVKRMMAMMKAYQGSHGSLAAAPTSLLETAYPAVANRDILLHDKTHAWPVATNGVIAAQHGLNRAELRANTREYVGKDNPIALGASVSTDSAVADGEYVGKGNPIQIQIEPAKLDPKVKSDIQSELQDIFTAFASDERIAKGILASLSYQVGQGTVVDPAILFERFGDSGDKGYLLAALAIRAVYGEDNPVAIPMKEPSANDKQAVKDYSARMALLNEINEFFISQNKAPFVVTTSVASAIDVLKKEYGVKKLGAIVGTASVIADAIREQIPDRQIITQQRFQALVSRDARFAGFIQAFASYYTIARSA